MGDRLRVRLAAWSNGAPSAEFGCAAGRDHTTRAVQNVTVLQGRQAGVRRALQFHFRIAASRWPGRPASFDARWLLATRVSPESALR
jgi:hypothetical protein